MTDQMNDTTTTDTAPGGLTGHNDGADTYGQVDPSASPPVVKWSEEWWAAAKPETRARRCKAHRKTGDQCKRLALVHQRVCSHHGGKAGQSLRAAKRRLAENADPAVRQLAKIAYDENVAVETRLKATLALIDRSVGGAKTSVEVEVGIASPMAQIVDGIADQLEVTSRAAFRASQGQADDDDSPLAGFPAIGVGGTEPIDAEIVDDDEYAGMRAARPDVNAGDQPETPGDEERARAEHTARRLRLRDESERDGGMEWVAATAATPAPTGDQYVTVVEGNEYLAELRRTAALARQAEIRDGGHAVIRRPQRQLPPGRSAR